MDYNAPSGSTDPNAPYVGKTSSTQGSKVPPRAVEYPQREILAAIKAAGLTPSNADLTQLAQAIALIAAAAAGGSGSNLAGLARGNCILSRANAGGILLAPRNGNGIVVGGSVVNLPAGGVSAGLTSVPVNGTAGGNLAASTAYYVSLAKIGSTPTLRFWNAAVYGHMPDTTAGNVGVEVISNGGAPVSTDTLVGMVYLDASGTFKDTDGARYLLSWFNRTAKKSVTGFTANRSTASTSLVELNGEIRNPFLCWGDGHVLVSAAGTCSSSNNYTAGYNYKGAGLSFDGGAAEAIQALAPGSYNANDPIPFNLLLAKQGLAEGLHYATLLGAVQSATGTWYAANNLAGTASAPTEACTITTIVNG